MGMTLHWGPYWPLNGYTKTTVEEYDHCLAEDIFSFCYYVLRSPMPNGTMPVGLHSKADDYEFSLKNVFNRGNFVV